MTRLHYFRELAAVQLRTLGLIELAQASYYEGHIKLAGYVEGLGKDEEFLSFRATGTQSDHMMELLSDPQKRTFQLHVCGPDRGQKETGLDIIHAAGYWLLDGEKKPWQIQYEGVDPKPAAGDESSRVRHDELAKLRTLHEERQAGVAGLHCRGEEVSQRGQ